MDSRSMPAVEGNDIADCCNSHVWYLAAAACGGTQCFAKCPFTGQFDWHSDQLWQSLDWLSDHFAKHWRDPVSQDSLLAVLKRAEGGLMPPESVIGHSGRGYTSPIP